MTDDFTPDNDFEETRGIWWAGIAFASIVTFAAIGGLLTLVTYVLSKANLVHISYWLPTVAAAILTVFLVSVAVKRGKIKYEPQ